MFGLKLRDISNSFRIYISDKLKSLDLECDNFDIVDKKKGKKKKKKKSKSKSKDKTKKNKSKIK